MGKIEIFEDPPTKPKRGKVRAAEMQPFVYGVLDELGPFACARFAKEFDNQKPEDLFKSLLLDLGEDVGEVADYRRNGDRALARAAAIRGAARLVAYLALDERVRGEKVINTEAGELNEHGFRARAPG